jgi:hypothetical protein
MTWSGVVAPPLVLALVACASGPSERPREREREPAAKPVGEPTMKTSTCDDARQAIRSRRFVGWRGMPRGCVPEALFDVAFDESWGLRKLGDDHDAARMRLLDITGYYRPLASVRDGEVVMFDGTNPELDGGWSALASDLGTPDATRDFVYSTVTMSGGERIHATRGITIFLNPENEMVLHVAVYAPTTVEDYEKRLRPSLDKHYR